MARTDHAPECERGTAPARMVRLDRHVRYARAHRVARLARERTGHAGGLAAGQAALGRGRAAEHARHAGAGSGRAVLHAGGVARVHPALRVGDPARPGERDGGPGPLLLGGAVAGRVPIGAGDRRADRHTGLRSLRRLRDRTGARTGRGPAAVRRLVWAGDGGADLWVGPGAGELRTDASPGGRADRIAPAGGNLRAARVRRAVRVLRRAGGAAVERSVAGGVAAPEAGLLRERVLRAPVTAFRQLALGLLKPPAQTLDNF